MEVRQFLAANIASIEQLEVLLLLRAGQERSWTPRDVYQRVMTNVNSIEQSLGRLCDKGLVRSLGESYFQFTSGSDMEEVLEQLATLYKERPARILYALYGTPSSEISAFADAFRIKKNP
jgi:hypothetical protein